MYLFPSLKTVLYFGTFWFLFKCLGSSVYWHVLKILDWDCDVTQSPNLSCQLMNHVSRSYKYRWQHIQKKDNSQPAEGRLRPKIIDRGRWVYSPVILTSTPNLVALLCGYVPVIFTSTPDFVALIADIYSSDFYLNSRLCGSYSWYIFQWFLPQLQIWWLLVI